MPRERKERRNERPLGLSYDDRRAERQHRTLTDKFCSFYVSWPRLSFAITLGIQLCFPMITGILYLMDFDILPYDFTHVPLNLETHPTKLRADAFNYASEDPRVNLQPTTILGQPERSVRSSPIELIYKAKHGNIMSQTNLKHIRNFETELHKNTIYQKSCHLDFNSKKCLPPLSIIRLFDGTFKYLDNGLFDPDFQNIARVLQIAKNISHTRGLLAFALDKSAVISSDQVTAHFLRSTLFHGLPLPGYAHVEDKREQQLERLKQYVQDAFADTLSKNYDHGIGDLKLYYLSMPLFFDAVHHQVIYDLLLAAGSISFIFCFIWFQTTSLWITCWALFGIVTNFFGANLVYRILLDYRYIGTFHVLSVFIILGIGADDIFVFYNTWKLMKQKKHNSLNHHLTETFRCAAGAMFVTSLTTMAAFLASAASPLLGVSSFGVFSGILVIINYLSVCVFFPSVVVVHHLFLSEKFCIFSRPSDQIKRSDNQRDGDVPVTAPIDEMFTGIVNWFQGPFVDYVVLHPVIRWICLVFFISTSIFFVAFAVQLKPDEEQVQVWPPGTNWHDIRQIRLNHFQESGEGDNVIRVYIIWGLHPQDRSKCHFTDYKCKGKTVFDTNFDLNPPECQLGILNLCRKLKNINDNMANKLKIRRSVVTGELEVACFMERMNEYLKAEALHGVRQFRYPEHTNLSIPFDMIDAKAVMRANPILYNASLLTEEYSRYFEVGLGYWLYAGSKDSSNGQKMVPSYDYIVYGNWMGGSLDPTAKERKLPRLMALAQGGKHGNTLRYIALVANTSLTGATLKYNLGNQVFKEWETLVREEMKWLPPACRGAFQCTPEWNNWHWLKVQEVLLQGAFQGIAIGLSLALPVLILTTFNWIIGLLATLTIALITLSVVGLIPMVGWKLGVMESLNLTLVVGLAVDYAVHLADGYVRSKHYKREDKVRDMVRNVGVSVLAGASTTLGASAFMLGAKILFFFQFGIFMFCTIGFSILYALGFFTVLTGLIGPEGESGSIRCLFPCLWRGAEDTDLTVMLPDDEIQEMHDKRYTFSRNYVTSTECCSPTLLSRGENIELNDPHLHNN